MFYSELLSAIVERTSLDDEQSVFEVAFDTVLSPEAKAILSFHNLLNCKQERNGFILFPADIILDGNTGYCSNRDFIPFAAVKNKSTCLAIRCDGTSEFVVLNRKSRVLDNKGFDFKSFLELIKRLQPSEPDNHEYRIVCSPDDKYSVYLCKTRMANKNYATVGTSIFHVADILMGERNKDSASIAPMQGEQANSSASVQLEQSLSDLSTVKASELPPVMMDTLEHIRKPSMGTAYSDIQEPPFDLEGTIDVPVESPVDVQPENSTAYKPFCFSEYAKQERKKVCSVPQVTEIEPDLNNPVEKEMGTAVQPCGDENKHDGDKVRLDLVEPSLINAVGRVRTFGVKKYPDEQSWRKVSKQRYIAATMRHFEAYRSGELLDPESGLPHLWHVACNIMFLIELEKNNA